MSAPKHWYYCDTSGQQQGPVDDKALIAEYSAGHLKDEGLIWCDALADWTPFAQVSEIYAQVQQAKAKTIPSAKVSAAAPRFGPGVGAKSNLVEQMAKKSMETLQQQSPNSVASPNVWTKVVGSDGYPYYTNNQTHETTWDRPDDYRSDEDEEPIQEQKPKAEVKQLSGKTTAKTTASTPAAVPGSASSAEDLDALKAAIASIKAELEKSTSSFRDSIKASEKGLQDKIQAQDKIIADLKTDLSACKSELKETKSQIAEYQKSISAMQTSVKSASESVAELKTSTQTQLKVIKNFAKSLADNIKE